MAITKNMSAIKKPLPRTLTEQVTERMRDAIVSGELRPGETLRADELAAAYGVSRVPIREALLKLASQGLVTLKANRGAVVTALAEDELEELIAISSSLEQLASCRGIERMDDTAFDRMKNLLDEMRAAEADPIEWYRLNEAFHAEMYKASGWSRLVSMIEDCRRNVARYITDTELHTREVASWHRQHCEIYEAARNRDISRLDQLIADHFAEAIEKAKPYINRKSMPGPQ